MLGQVALSPADLEKLGSMIKELQLKGYQDKHINDIIRAWIPPKEGAEITQYEPAFDVIRKKCIEVRKEKGLPANNQLRTQLDSICVVPVLMEVTAGTKQNTCVSTSSRTLQRMI